MRRLRKLSKPVRGWSSQPSVLNGAGTRAISPILDRHLWEAAFALGFPVADDGTIDIPVNRPAQQGGRSRLREGRGQQADVWPHWGAVTALISHTSLDSLDACALWSPSSSNRRHSYPLWLFAKAP